MSAMQRPLARSSSTASPSGRRRCPAGTRARRRSAASQAAGRPPAKRPAPEHPRPGRTAPRARHRRARARGAAARGARLGRRGDACLSTSSPRRTATSRINDYMCATLAATPTLISPTKFHNSVHNAAAGYWTHRPPAATSASTALTAFDASFGAGLLEAASQCAGRRARRCCWSRSTSRRPARWRR